MRIYQAEFHWRDTESYSMYTTLDAAKASFNEPDPLTGKPRFGGERMIHEWETRGEQFVVVATHYFENNRWVKPGEWMLPEGETIEVWVKSSDPQER